MSSEPVRRAVAASYACACGLLLLYFLFLPYGGYARVLDGKFNCFLVLSVPYALYMLAFSVRHGLRLSRADLPALGFFLFALLSAILSPFGAAVWLGGTRREGMLSLTLYVLLFFFLRRYLHPDRTLLRASAVGVTLCDLLIFWQLAGGNPLGLYPDTLTYYDGDVQYAGFYAGTAGNVDFTAFLLAIAFCGLLLAAIRKRSERWLFLPAALTAAALVLLRVSAALLGIVLTLICSLGLLFPKRRRLLALGSLGLLMIGLFALYCIPWQGGTLYEASRLLHGEAEGYFGSSRVWIWRELLPLIAQRPLFGSGPESLALQGLAPFYWYHDSGMTELAITSAHNEWLSVAVNLGLPALLCYLWGIAEAIRAAFRRADTVRFAACGAMLLCYVFASLFNADTCITAPYLPLLLALLLPYEKKKTE